jgi:general secretion pathway protein A
MEYYHHFRMTAPPFQPASPNSAVYLSPTHIAGLATLESGLTGELTGLTMLTGEAGTGKTTLIYSLLQRDYKRIRVALVEDPKLSFIELMRVVLSQMNLYTTGSSKVDYLETLDKLLKLRGEEERIAIIVDESQLLSDDVLEELRLLSNRADRSLQLILVGHPELAERLKKPELRQINQRISSRGVLTPLAPAQAIKYVECKLSAQGTSCAQVFERGALKRLLRRSDGIPRKINMLCHTALHTAYMAGERKVSYKTASKVAAAYHDSLKIERRGFSLERLKTPALYVGGALAALLLLSFLRTRSGPVNQAASASEPARQVARAAAPARPDRAAAQAQTATPAYAGADPGNSVARTTRPELRASLNAAAPPASPASSVAAPAAAPVAVAPAPAAPGQAAAQKQSGASAAPLLQGSQITVQNGDTLEKIAIRYYRSDAGISELIKANPQLTDVNHLTIGQVINLPPGIGGHSRTNPGFAGA